jgi:hypothetical protein
MNVTGCLNTIQVNRWVFQNFKVKICQFLVHNGRLVRSNIFLKKQDSIRNLADLSPPSAEVKNGGAIPRFVWLQCINVRQSIGVLWRGISPSQSCYLHRTTQTQNKRRQTSMPWEGLEPMIPAFERAKACHALDRAVTVLGCISLRFVKYECFWYWKMFEV